MDCARALQPVSLSGKTEAHVWLSGLSEPVLRVDCDYALWFEWRKILCKNIPFAAFCGYTWDSNQVTASVCVCVYCVFHEVLIPVLWRFWGVLESPATTQERDFYKLIRSIAWGKGQRLAGRDLEEALDGRCFPVGSEGKEEPACQCRRCGFHPWVGKIPWRRAWQPIPVFLPGESRGQNLCSLGGYSSWGRKESDTT